MATLLFIHRFRRSRLGTSALMVQMNPDLATALGIDARKVRLAVFVASAPISALAGWLYAYQRAYVGPDMFETYFLVLMLTAIVIVGRRLLLGPLIGTALIIVQQTFFSIGGDGDKIVLGSVLAAILLLWPRGLVGLWSAVGGRRRDLRFARTAHAGRATLRRSGRWREKCGRPGQNALMACVFGGVSPRRDVPLRLMTNQPPDRPCAGRPELLI